MEVTSKLMEAEINIRAVASFDTPEFGILRMVVDQPERAKETLTRLGFVVRIYDVVGVELKDEKGNLKIDKDIVKAVRKADRIHIIACGTSYNAGLVGKEYLEKWLEF